MQNSDVMHTSNPKTDYKFSWTIENFVWTSKKLRGPPFLPIPEYPYKFCFEIEHETGKKFTKDKMFICWFYNFHVRLLCLNVDDPQFYVSGDIVLSNSQSILFRKTSDITQIRPSTALITHNPDQANGYHFSIDLKDSRLKLEGTLTFSSYQLSSRLLVVPPPVPQPAENCTCREVLNDLLTMYKSGQGSDVTFSVGAEKIRAHKAIISARSPVFAKMFEHDMVENNTNNVTIEDIDSGTFNDFLVFLYTGDAGDLKCKSALSLYPASRKYQVKSLQKVCLVSLGNTMNVDCVCDAMLLADLFEDADLEEIVKLFIQNNFLDIVVTTKWAELITSQPELVKKVTGFIKPASV